MNTDILNFDNKIIKLTPAYNQTQFINVSKIINHTQLLL